MVTGNEIAFEKVSLVDMQILGLLVNTFTTDEKYLVLNRKNLTISIEMELSQKKKTFSELSAAFSKSRLNFEYFETKR